MPIEPTPAERLLLIGAGGHAKVVLDALRQARCSFALEVRDDSAADGHGLLLDVNVATPVGDAHTWPSHVHVAIGDNAVRRQFGQKVVNAGKILYTAIHPHASVSPFARLGAGVFVAAHGVVGPSATVDTGTIVNHGAVVDHDCWIGAWTHIAPGAVLGGAVRVGVECLIGSGAVILPGVVVGDGAVIGSGAVVTRDVKSGDTVIGVPARSSKRARATGGRS